MALIGITGTLGSGKGTVVEYLVNTKGFVYFSVTAFLRAEVERRGITPNRIAYHDLANEYRMQGSTRLMEAVYRSALPVLARRESVVIEAQHTPEEVRFIQSKGGIEFAVDAAIETRYRRITARGSEKDRVTFEAFKEIEERELSGREVHEQNLRGAIEAADYRLTNDGTLEELHQQIDRALVASQKI